MEYVKDILTEIAQQLSNEIYYDDPLNIKLDHARNILKKLDGMYYDIMHVNNDFEYAIHLNGTSAIIPLEGYWILSEHINNAWAPYKLLARVELFETNANNIALFAMKYPAAFIIIKESYQEMVFNTALKVPQISFQERAAFGYYYGYDLRYRQVYNADADTLETKNSNEVLQYFYENYPEWFEGEIIDLGCGDGRDTLFLAKQGLSVIGIDISRSAITKAREIAKRHGLNVRYFEKDIVFLREEKRESYSLAINMGCLHMITDSKQRIQHLERVFEILKPGGRFILAYCKENQGKGFYSTPQWNNLPKMEPNQIILRKIRTSGKPTETKLPVIPYKESSIQELLNELISVGFNVYLNLTENIEAFSDTAVIVAIKE